MGRSSQRRRGAASPEGEHLRPREHVSLDDEAELLRLLWAFGAQMRDARDGDGVLRRSLELAQDFFRAPAGCIAEVRPGLDAAQIVFSSPAGAHWDATVFADFLRGLKASVPPDLMLARIRRFGRMWGVIALECPGADFQWNARAALSWVGSLATQLLERIDDDRIHEVRGRIDQKILEQLAPKDLSYQILHGIRSLIGYDHSAALLLLDDACRELNVVGEQIAWRKAKSQRVGFKVAVPHALLDLLKTQQVYGFDHDERGWNAWTAGEANGLADLLDYNRDGLPARLSVAEGAMLCAPLAARGRILGVLKVASQHPGSFGPHEARTILQFLPQVSVALQNMRRAEALEVRMHAAERKQAMADLARGVAHDVNNALGAVLPLIQQLRDEFQEGHFDANVVSEDLEQVEKSLQICRRIFGGMLTIARNSNRNASDIHVGHAIENALTIFREGLDRAGVSVSTHVDRELPPLVGLQSDLDQLVINLVSNARDAMPNGGQLTIRAAFTGKLVELTVEDSGCGIAADQLERIQEPFFTTKSNGNGLGLSICRSLVSQMRGRLQISSQQGHGTRVFASLPIAQAGSE